MGDGKGNVAYSAVGTRFSYRLQRFREEIVGMNRDNRQTIFHQKYRSEVETLALCKRFEEAAGELHTEAFARIRITKDDIRLPLTVAVAFEPDSGNPDKAVLTTTNVPKIYAAELMLTRRAYVPIRQVIGNLSNEGPIDFPSRLGNLGIALQFSAECDAIDLIVHMFHACGEKNPITQEYSGGRWVTQYMFTTNERLSIEEWNDVISKTNRSIERFYKKTTVEGSTLTDSFEQVSMPEIYKALPE